MEQTMTLPLQTLSTKQAAQQLGISRITLWRYVQRKLIRPLRTGAGGRNRYAVRELDRFIEANTRELRA
jgi:excisionase family DNA binding protein